MPSRFILLLLFVTAAFFSALAPAHAGHWSVSYTYTLTSVGSVGGDSTSSGTVATLPEIYGGFGVGHGNSGNYTQTLTVTATLTWGADSPQEVPPDKVTFVEQGHAWGFGMTHTVPAQNGLVDPKPTADDGLGDANTPTNTDNTRADASSEGSQPTQKPWASTITLPTRTLTFSFTHDAVNSDGGSGNSSLSYQVIIVSPSLSGYSTADTAGWDPAHPRFFSGTACTASGIAAAASGYVSHAQLCIGENGSDTVVKEYYDKSLAPFTLPDDGSIDVGTALTSTPLEAIFDSTHFKDAAKVKLTLKVWDSNGRYYDADVSAPAKNRMYAYGNPNLTHISGANFYNGLVVDDILGRIKQDCDEMNYSAVTTKEDEKPTVLATLPYYTALYVDSHGYTNSFGDCNAQEDSGDEHFIDFGDAQGAIAVKTQNPNLPPYNFVFLDCCNTAGDPTVSPPISSVLANSLLNGTTPSELPDRAFLGWKNTTWSIGQNARWTKLVFDDLSNGATLSDATLDATTTFPELGPISDGSAIPRFVFPEIFGDTEMTMHTVYRRSELGDQWYRPL